MGKRKLAMADVSPEDQAFMDENATDQELAAKSGGVTVDGDATPESNEADEPVEQEQEEEDQSNSPSVQKARRGYIVKVSQHGAKRGAGGKALVEFAKTVVEGAFDGVLRPKVDAKALYEAFRKGAERAGALAEAPGVVPDADIAFGEASSKDNKNKSFDVQVSKLNKFLRFGKETRGTDLDANEIIATGIAVHAGMLRDGANLKYRSTYAALGELVGEQLKDEHGTTALTVEEMQDLFAGTEPKVKTGLDLVRNALDTCNKALKGKVATDNQEGREAVSSANLERAVEALRDTINELDPSGKTLEDIDAKAKKSDAALMVAQFRAALKHPPTINTEYRLISNH